MKQKYQRFPPHTKTDRHDIAEILLKVALNNVKQQLKLISCYKFDTFNSCISLLQICNKYDKTEMAGFILLLNSMVVVVMCFVLILCSKIL